MQIPLSRPDVTEAERRAVLEVLSTPDLALGPRLAAFESALAGYHDRRFALAVNSGTSALHLAMLALGVGPGDEVVTTPFSFIASTNCILYVGATPRFVDVDPATWNLDAGRVPEAIGPATRAILPVHVFGLPCDMEAIGAVAAAGGLGVVEDACEAIGAYDRRCIAGKAADVSALAFYPNKQITTGEGGALLTDDPRKAALCRSLRNQGRAEGGAWLCHERLGYNYRLSDVAAALGLAQLGRLDEILGRRSRTAARYDQRLGGLDWLRGQTVPAGARKSWFAYVVRLADDFDRPARDAILRDLRARGIGCSNYFPPIHLQPHVAARLGHRPGDFPVCEALADRTVALPFHGRLTESEIDRVCEALARAAAAARPARVRLAMAGETAGERAGA